MDGSKVTVSYKICQKKKVKCTWISPCTNCIRAGQRCEFTETAKKSSSRNGNVKAIKSSENVLQENLNLRGQIEQAFVHNNTRPAVRSVRSHPVNNPVVISDDVTTDVSQSHGIPRSILMQERYDHDTYSRDINVPVEPQQTSPISWKSIPIYPVTMQRSGMDSPNASLNKTNSISLPPITELDQQFAHIDIFTHNSSQSRMALSTHNRVSRKKMSMPIVNMASGIEVLLPPAPDLENSLDSTTMMIDNHPIKLPPLDLPAQDKFALSLSSPPSIQSCVSPKSNDFCNMPFKKY